MATSKHEINLQFNADTSNVSKELDKLQGKLKQLSEGQGVIGQLTITKDVNNAMNAAAKLQTILKNSRLDTGKLDIVSFQDNLAKAGLSVEDLSRHFASLGPQGAKAFDQLTQSIMTAENPMRRTSTLLTSFATTLKNTAKWQLSSSILHGFMSSVQHAYGYAKDLNESLNNIRIVSKQNTDQMAQFAKEANEAAKALSVSTTAYTDAALIFYQQGLKGEDVTSRTDVVAKMSNVTKDSVDEVSSYMTAIWNNFDDGSESLEHYADVITGLGAATASSSAEIAAGLEKFAAVADTVGLSYDYATSALATVVAQTRQSADTVGTAFKTLFARIEGLKLGETLDDGVDLNKYSAALEKVGVNILNANGELRDMDSILEDLGARWGQLDKASQVALAQTVAGTRQYNQLVALLDNWDKVQENLNVARSSDGELQQQADIYAQSWEAARKRVEAAAQGIYSSLIDEDFFIKLDNGIATVLNGVSKVIDSLGGIKSLWPMLFTIFGKLFGGELNIGFSNVFKNLYSQTQAALQQIEQLRNKFSNENFELSITYDNKATERFEQEYKRISQEIIEAQSKLKNMSAETAEETQAEIDSVVSRLSNLKQYLEDLIQKEKQLQQEIVQNNVKISAEAQSTNNLKNQSTQQNSQSLIPQQYFKDDGTLNYIEETNQQLDNTHSKLTSLTMDFKTISDGIVQLFAEFDTKLKSGELEIDQIKNDIIGNMETIFSTISSQDIRILQEDELPRIQQLFDNIKNGAKTADQDLLELIKTFKDLLSESREFAAEDIEGLSKVNPALKKTLEYVTQLAEKLGLVRKESENVNATMKNIGISSQKDGGAIPKSIVPNVDLSKTVVQASQFAMSLTQINNLVEQINDNTKSTGEKFLSIVTSLSMMGFSLKGSLGFINSIHSGLTAILSGEVKQSVIKAINLKLTQKQAAAQAQIAKDEAIETANDTTQAGLKAAGNATSTVGAGTGAAAGTAGATAGTTGAAAGNSAGGMLAALGGSAAAVAASVVLIVGALAGVAAYIVHKVNMQNLKKEAEKAAAKETKQAEKIEEVTAELDAIDQLAESYDDLKANMDSMTREQAKAQAIQLAAQYEDESLMILALTESYEKLEAQIKKTQAARQEEAARELKTGVEYNKDNILAQAQQAAGSAKDAGGDKWDLGHGNGEYTRIAIENLLDKQNYQFEAGTKMLKEDWESMWEKATTDPEAFKKFQQEVVDAAARGENAAIHLKEYIDAAGDSIKAAADNVNKLKQLKLETAFNEIYNGLKGAIDGADDFFNFVDQVKAKDSEASDSDVIRMASTYANTQDSAVYGETALSVADQQGWDLEIAEDKEKFDNLVEDLKKYDKDTVAVLGVQVNVTGSIVDKNGHINLKESGLTEDQLKTLGRVQHEKSEINKIQGAMSKFDPTKAAKGNAWSKKDRAEMGDIEGLNLNASDEDILEQLRKLEQDHIKTLEDKKKAADELTESMAKLADSEEIRYHNLEGYGKVDLKNETEESMQQKANIAIQHQSLGNTTVEDFSTDFSPKEMITSELTGDDLKQSLEEAEEQGKSLRDELVLISEYYADKLPDNAKEFDEQIKKVYADLNIEEEENKELIKNSIKLRKDATNAIKKYNQQTKISEDVIAALNSEIEAQGDSLETLQNRVIAASQSMDNMQTAYKSLKGIEAQYAEDHFLTVDSFQEILNLEPQYLSALEFENGQLKVNEGTLQEVAIARVRNMETEQAEVMMKELDIIATRGEDDEERQLLLTKYASIAANQIAGYTMEEVARKAEALAASNSKLAATYNNVAAAARNYAAAADATVKGLQTNFSKAMGYSPKGGGGSKKSKETKDLKEYADEFDRFYPYQKVIDDIADAMSDLAKAQDHLAGGELVGALRKQNRLLEQQKKAYQDLAKEQKKYQKEMQADLAKYGMSFDTYSGNIVNYAQSTQKMLDQYNAAIEKYNKSAQADADKKALETVEKEYEKFKKLVSDYQGILTEIQDTENSLDDIYYEQIANNLKEFEIMVQVKLDIGEARRMVNNFISEINKNFKTLKKTTQEWMSVFDNALKNAHTYIDGDLGTINVDMDALNKVKNAIDSGDYGHEGAMFASESEAIVKYKELAEQLKDDAEELYDLYKEAWEDYLDAVDEAIEEWEEIIDNFDEINDTLDHYEKVIELLHNHQNTDQGYDELINLYNRQMDLQLVKQATLRKQIETLQSEYKELIASGAKENDEDVKKIQDAIKEANKSLQSSIEDYLETINKAFDKQIEKANKDSMIAALGFDPDLLSEEWDKAKKAQEGYYDETERIYQLDKLRRKYTEAINNTDNLKLQKKLAELQEEELKRLEEKKILSEADIAIAEKKLAVEQARIALEDAQDNKSQMRLQRDSQGNWSYQFVADEDNLADKQQQLMDAENDLYETAKQANSDCVEFIKQLWQSWHEERLEIINNETLSEEEKLAKLEELDAYYVEQIGLRAESLRDYRVQLNDATADLLLAGYQVNEENYRTMTDTQKALVDELKERSIQDTTDIATAAIETYEAIQTKATEVNQESINWWDQLTEVVQIDSEQMTQASEDFYNRVLELINEYDEAIRRSEEASGIAWSNIQQAVEDTGYAIDEVTDKVQECVDRSQQLSDFRARVNEIEDAWLSVKDSITSALNELNSYLSKLLEVKDMQDVVKKNATDAAEGLESDLLNSNSNSGSSQRGTGATSSESVRYNLYGNGTYGTWTDIDTKKTVNGPSTNTSNSVRGMASKVRQQEAIDSGDLWRKYGITTHFATGGYTGSWSDGDNNGKLAVLHQKELVLNSSDTKNILDAVQAIRDAGSGINFSKVISDAATQMVSAALNNISSILPNASTIVNNANNSQTEQNVHIEASFPNVQNSHEIEDAFNNLVNIASQRIV